ncbi:MAG: hypothetical protein HGA87_07185, partial [Desulfobulbaceae bacterium]|nr:hypothetical protein [Desulfobulbaceae bacterium]
MQAACQRAAARSLMELYLMFDNWHLALAAYNRGDEWDLGVAINHKYGSFPQGAAVFDIERGQLKEIRPLFWQNDTSVANNSWGYVEPQEYKTATSLIHELADTLPGAGFEPVPGGLEDLYFSTLA